MHHAARMCLWYMDNDCTEHRRRSTQGDTASDLTVIRAYRTAYWQVCRSSSQTKFSSRSIYAVCFIYQLSYTPLRGLIGSADLDGRASAPVMGCGYQLQRLMERLVVAFQLELPGSKVKQSARHLCQLESVRELMLLTPPFFDARPSPVAYMYTYTTHNPATMSIIVLNLGKKNVAESEHRNTMQQSSMISRRSLKH